MDERLTELEAKIDHLQECLYTLMRYIEERDRDDFDRQVLANVCGDIVFESLANPQSFFDQAGRG